MSNTDEAAPDENAAVTQAQEPASVFADQSYLTYLVPSETDLDLAKAFQSPNHEGSILDSLAQRDSLFFGEPSLLPGLTTPGGPNISQMRRSMSCSSSKHHGWTKPP